MSGNETYTVMFKIDRENDEYELCVCEYARNGTPYLVNSVNGTDVIDIFEALTGRDVLDEEDDY